MIGFLESLTERIKTKCNDFLGKNKKGVKEFLRKCILYLIDSTNLYNAIYASVSFLCAYFFGNYL